MNDNLFVTVTLTRANGTVVLKVVGSATGKVEWQAPTPDSRIAANGTWLDGFEYIPVPVAQGIQ